MKGSCPSPVPNVITPQNERAMHQLVEDGPVKNVGELFVDVLTVPQELRQRIFYWPEEREFCEHVSSVGRALDTLTTVHRTFLGQFKILSNLRATFIQAPTEFFVAPMYFCDRALDSLLRSTRKVQNDIKDLFNDLAQLESECSWRYRWTKKAYLEDKYPKDNAARKESATRPDMEIKEQRVLLLAELSERIGMVRRGGSNVFSLLGRQWLPGYPHDKTPRDPDNVVMITGGVDNTHQEDPSVNERSGSAQSDAEGSESLATPIPQSGPDIPSRLTQNVENPVEVPETPEVRHSGGLVITQRSSLRKRKPSQSSGRSEATDTDKHVQFLARNLMGSGSADLPESPAQKSGASIETIRAVSQRDNGVTHTPDQVANADVQVGNQVEMRLPRVTNNRPESGKELPSDARIALHNPSQDHEKNDEERVRSLSI